MSWRGRKRTFSILFATCFTPFPFVLVIPLKGRVVDQRTSVVVVVVRLRLRAPLTFDASPRILSSASSIFSNQMSKLIRIYTRSFERRPYLTLLVRTTSSSHPLLSSPLLLTDINLRSSPYQVANGLLFSLGDFGAQTLAHFDASAALPVGYDAARTIRFLVFGASMGPFAGLWNSESCVLVWDSCLGGMGHGGNAGGAK